MVHLVEDTGTNAIPKILAKRFTVGKKAIYGRDTLRERGGRAARFCNEGLRFATRKSFALTIQGRPGSETSWLTRIPARSCGVLDLQTAARSVVPESQGMVGGQWITQDTLVASRLVLGSMRAFDFRTQKWSNLAPGTIPKLCSALSTSPAATFPCVCGVNLTSKRILIGVSAALGVEAARPLAAHGASDCRRAAKWKKAKAATEQVRKDTAASGMKALTSIRKYGRYQRPIARPILFWLNGDRFMSPGGCVTRARISDLRLNS